MNWLDFGRDPPKVKCQWTWSKYAIFTSLPRNLKNPLVDFHHTWPRGAPWRVDELIRFWARSAQGQRSMNLVKKCYFTSLPRYLKNPWADFYHTWRRGAPWQVDQLIRFWASQRSKVNELGLNILFLPRYREISRSPGWIFIKLDTGVHHEE